MHGVAHNKADKGDIPRVERQLGIRSESTTQVLEPDSALLPTRAIMPATSLCHLPRARNLVRTKFGPLLARAGWARCIARTTRAWIASSPSKSCQFPFPLSPTDYSALRRKQRQQLL